MIIADPMPTFPVLPSYGFIASPRYLVSVVEREGGFEKVNRLWARPLLHLTSVPLEDVSVSDTEKLINFYHAMGGSATYFRCRDYSDYRAEDQPLVEIVASPGSYQLVKHYTSGGVTQVREIYKPVGDTVVVKNELGVEQTDWTLDEANGVLVPGPTFSGVPTFWSGDFDVEVRFVGGLDVEIVDFGTRSARVAMKEKRRAATT